MENASKALIIAGAILLAIVIISLGLVVVNNVRSTIDNTNMNAQEIEAFNGKFTPYAGDRIQGSKVNALIAVVSSSNADSLQKDTDAGVTTDAKATQPYVGITFTPKSATAITVNGTLTAVKAANVKYPSANTSKYYSVEISMTKGKVSKIDIKEL